MGKSEIFLLLLAIGKLLWLCLVVQDAGNNCYPANYVANEFD